ncbi:uncharacterized protein LOC115901591 [Camarhynchus parvulus]|uniref:uncharacterized protein LOC115901591 n=1 Tax=Geospiza parvula TaxID=87175 RepID=UPI001237FC3C|nr:uncharacterized protein LOC115901591 [Camarhynchus parvulus]
MVLGTVPLFSVSPVPKLSHYASALVQPQPLVFRGDVDCSKPSIVQEHFTFSQTNKPTEEQWRGKKQSLSELPTLSLGAFGDPLEMLLYESIWNLRGLLEWFGSPQKCPLVQAQFILHWPLNMMLSSYTRSRLFWKPPSRPTAVTWPWQEITTELLLSELPIHAAVLSLLKDAVNQQLGPLQQYTRRIGFKVTTSRDNMTALNSIATISGYAMSFCPSVLRGVLQCHREKLVLLIVPEIGILARDLKIFKIPN